MNRNVSIVIAILVLVVIAGYLVWIRSKYQSPTLPQPSPEVTATPSVSPSQPATPSANPKSKEATSSMKQKTSTSSSTSR